MRVTRAFAFAWFAAAASGCQLAGNAPAQGPVLPELPAARPAASDCTLVSDAPEAVDRPGLGLLDRLRDPTTDPGSVATAALLAGTLSTSAGDLERAYAFCSLVPVDAIGDKREEAAVCQTKAAITMGRARTACADLLAREWIADRSRIGLSFAGQEP